MTTYKSAEQRTIGGYDFNDMDDTDDISDDEVFLRDSRIAVDDESSVSRPLMAPRRKVKTNKLHTEVRRLPPCRVICAPVCYGVTAFGALMGIICLVIFLVSTLSTRLGNGVVRPSVLSSSQRQVVGCTHLQVEDVWTQNFPKLLTESSIRLVDVDGDAVLDVILGFATGADGYNIPTFVCDIYFDGEKPCFGGVLALNGKTGVEIWRHYLDHEVFALNCNEDLDGDKVNDCLAGGRAGTFQAVSGKDGKMLWNFGPQEAKNDVMNVYTAQFLPDQDGDGIVDVILVHGGDPLAEPGSEYRLSGRIVVLSGKNGNVLRWVGVPGEKESYYSPQLLVHPDGTELVLFGTGGETHSGGLYYITLDDLMKGNIKKAKLIYHDDHKGVMTPPTMVDVTGDGIEDIVIAMFNSTVVAFDGLTFRQIWNFTIPSSESYSTPAAGFFNGDNVPDIFVKYQVGPGFPIYYYSQSTVLDGVTGKPLLPQPVRDTVGAQASPLTISVEGLGNDIFLYWTSDCLGHEGQSQEFTFLKGTNVHEQSRSDFCQLRFNSRLISRLYALSNNWSSPGFAVYNSDDRRDLEYNNTVNTSAIALEYVRTHPDSWELYRQYASSGNDLYSDLNGNSNPSGASAAARMRNRGRQRNWQKGRKGSKVRVGDVPSGVHPNAEYEEDVHYSEVPHSVRKHGRYNKGGMQHNDQLRGESSRDDLSYLDAMSQEYDGGQGLPDNDLLEKPPSWERGWYKAYPNSQEEYDAGGRYRTGGRNRGNYKNYYQNRKKDYYSPDDERRQYPEDESDLEWSDGRDYNKRAHRFRDSGRVVKKRKRRHVGPHDDDGIQRLISTGTLAPVLDPSSPDANHSIDIIFATYWFFPAKTQAILPEDRDCIQRMMGKEQERFLQGNRYFGLDHDAFEEAVTRECLQQSGRQPAADNHTYESQSDYDPFNIHMGQMTVYRVRLRCSCSSSSSQGHDEQQQQVETGKPPGSEDERGGEGGGGMRTCARILPFEQQGWAAYMGSRADSHFVRRTTT